MDTDPSGNNRSRRGRGCWRTRQLPLLSSPSPHSPSCPPPRGTASASQGGGTLAVGARRIGGPALWGHVDHDGRRRWRARRSRRAGVVEGHVDVGGSALLTGTSITAGGRCWVDTSIMAGRRRWLDTRSFRGPTGLPLSRLHHAATIMPTASRPSGAPITEPPRWGGADGTTDRQGQSVGCCLAPRGCKPAWSFKITKMGQALESPGGAKQSSRGCSRTRSGAGKPVGGAACSRTRSGAGKPVGGAACSRTRSGAGKPVGRRKDRVSNQRRRPADPSCPNRERPSPL